MLPRRVEVIAARLSCAPFQSRVVLHVCVLEWRTDVGFLMRHPPLRRSRALTSAEACRGAVRGRGRRPPTQTSFACSSVLPRSILSLPLPILSRAKGRTCVRARQPGGSLLGQSISTCFYPSPSTSYCTRFSTLKLNVHTFSHF